MLVHGTLADAQALLAQSDVAQISANHTLALPPEAIEPAAVAACSPDEPSNPICWNIRKIGADRVWQEFGINGQGIVVANIDTGVNFGHPALSPSYRGNLGAGRYDHNYNWYEPRNGLPTPTDARVVMGRIRWGRSSASGRWHGRAARPLVSRLARAGSPQRAAMRWSVQLPI